MRGLTSARANAKLHQPAAAVNVRRRNSSQDVPRAFAGTSVGEQFCPRLLPCCGQAVGMDCMSLSTDLDLIPQKGEAHVEFEENCDQGH